tara:strand:- start:90 stop:437 length:348 start_codon:yes stop_codon:yes gene_type:complete
MKEPLKGDFGNSIRLLITPNDKGFSCAIDTSLKNKMNAEEQELCLTITRGLVKQATSDPHGTFLLGVKAFAEDRKNGQNDLIQNNNNQKEDDNVIDFLKFLESKKTKELDYEDPF